MAKLAATLMNDVVAKMVFDGHPELLQAMVADMLGLDPAEISDFALLNIEVPPQRRRGKFAKLDLHMRMNGGRVCLELQNGDPGNFMQRILFYWASLYIAGVGAGENYSLLQTVTVISVLAFKAFAGPSFHSHHTIAGPRRLMRKGTDQQDPRAFPWLNLHFFELPKVPALTGPSSHYTDTADGRVVVCLHVFRATTDAELEAIECLGVDAVNKLIARFRFVLASDELREAQRQEQLRRLDENNALAGARAEGKGEGKAEGRAEGVAKGAAESKVQDILTVLEHREVTLTRAQRKRILRCTNLATLDAWFHRALKVTDAASLFATLPEDDRVPEPAAS